MKLKPPFGFIKFYAHHQNGVVISDKKEEWKINGRMFNQIN